MSTDPRTRTHDPQTLHGQRPISSDLWYEQRILLQKTELQERLAAFGQQHLLQFWDELDAPQQHALARQIEQLDLPLLGDLFSGEAAEEDWAALAERAESPPAIRLGSLENPIAAKDAVACGEEILRQGKVAVLLVAGGQGTRLGFDQPKGMYPLGPVSGRTLFQIHVDRLRAASRHYGVSLPLLLMTSPATHSATIEYFQQNHRLGLNEDELVVFCQGTMPAVEVETGRILLADRGRVFLSPDGHGGALAALERAGCLAMLQDRGIERLFYFQVDNPLVDIASPEFLGYHVLSESEMTTQVVAKKHPQDKVGNVVCVDGQLRIIEYSDLPDRCADRRNPDGSLAIWAGSIAVHVFDVAFLRRLAARGNALPIHRARKIVPYVDSAGNLVQPPQPNALKYERFIFDLLPAAHHAIVVEIDAQDGFAPLKNASGEPRDTPEGVRSAMIAQHRRWLTAAGAELVDGVAVEINPLFARDSAELSRRLAPGTLIKHDTYFAEDDR